MHLYYMAIIYPRKWEWPFVGTNVNLHSALDPLCQSLSLAEINLIKISPFISLSVCFCPGKEDANIFSF